MDSEQGQHRTYEVSGTGARTPAVDIRHAIVETVLGALTVTAAGGHITGVYFPGHWKPAKAHTLGLQVAMDQDPLLVAAATQLNDYLIGRRDCFDLPTATNGDAFQEAVWAVLWKIPYGRTTTYGAIAEQLGNRALAQRVGQAVGSNPISVILPCHRVVGAGGRLTGYAGGLERKRYLLDLELPAEDVLFSTASTRPSISVSASSCAAGITLDGIGSGTGPFELSEDRIRREG